MFTDIESSTRWWAEHPEAMQVALERHDRLLVTVLNSRDGTVFKHTGDGVAVVFGSVRAAVEGAVETQRRLAAVDWSPLGELRVRMAIHVGEAEARGGDWYGPALNRTARLMGIGHGGQVLLSGAAHSLVAERPPDGVDLADLGEHRLRDLLLAESVWQVVAPGLRREFPPLRSMNTAKGNLPTQLTGFVGRAVEALELGELIRSNRLTTMIGPGGMGKTRLALQTGAAAERRIPGRRVVRRPDPRPARQLRRLCGGCGARRRPAPRRRPA